MKQRINSSLLLFFCFQFFSAQIDVKFIEHLSSVSLPNEHLAYLNTLSPASDSVFYYKAKYNLKYFNDSLFLLNYQAASDICKRDTILLNEAGIQFLKNDSRLSRAKWFDSFKYREGEVLKTVYDASEHPDHFSENTFPSELRRSFKSYKKVYSKKPLLAASFSAIVPGLGKLYAGKKRSALAAFLINSGYALQTAESIKLLGVRHPFTIVNLCAFSVFYLSNIYGAYRAVPELRKERKKQFLTDAANFYN